MTHSVEGKAIVELVNRYAELEWAKSSKRYVTDIVDGNLTKIDRSSVPPFATFRIKNENPELIEAIRRAVTAYRGRVEWVLVAHARSPLPGTNWMICPKKTIAVADEALNKGVDVSRYLSLVSPELGPVAHDDVGGLLEFIEKELVRTFGAGAS